MEYICTACAGDKNKIATWVNFFARDLPSAMDSSLAETANRT